MQRKKQIQKKRRTKLKKLKRQMTRKNRQKKENKGAGQKEVQTEEDNNESDANVEDEREIALEYVVEGEEGTMLDAREKELEEELTNSIEANDGDATDEEVYDELLEML